MGDDYYPLDLVQKGCQSIGFIYQCIVDCEGTVKQCMFSFSYCCSVSYRIGLTPTQFAHPCQTNISS